MKNNISNASSTPKGIIKDSKGIGITTSGLPMSDHFFQATGFRLKLVSTNLHIVFGAQSAFAEPEDQEYRLAIEMVYPIENAKKYLYKMNWTEKSASSTEPFAEVIQKSIDKSISSSNSKIYKIPSGSNFRSFPSNFSVMSMSMGQGSIEFFEVPPSLVVEAIYGKNGWRPNSDVRAILTVILPPDLLYIFLTESKEILQPSILNEIEV